jgi:hypothetical protein
MDLDFGKAAEFLGENFDGTIVKAFNLFCPDGACLKATEGAIVSTTQNLTALDTLLGNE